jgi:hypothetical protein
VIYRRDETGTHCDLIIMPTSAFQMPTSAFQPEPVLLQPIFGGVPGASSPRT